jgi:hypothetical protein
VSQVSLYLEVGFNRTFKYPPTNLWGEVKEVADTAYKSLEVDPRLVELLCDFDRTVKVSQVFRHILQFETVAFDDETGETRRWRS